MIGRLILKAISVLTFVCIAIVGLAVILLVGWFFLAMVFPNRMNVIGRVTDSAGRPIKAVQVRAHPLAIFDAHSENSTKPARAKAQIVFTDGDGRFRFERLIASGGVKEGMWLQEYDIIINAEGHRPEKIHLRNSCDRHMDLIKLEDIVLEEEKPDIISPKAPGFMPGVRNSIPCRMPRHLLAGFV
ncbi:MAG TPA: carboxypeptidase regulatory-like domain-containing protein [Planctomycetes bacterium]|nr:carboxypeptidase regulatory-like domain-containing protein [Planctomycetota bacterium]